MRDCYSIANEQVGMGQNRMITEISRQDCLYKSHLNTVREWQTQPGDSIRSSHELYFLTHSCITTVKSFVLQAPAMTNSYYCMASMREIAIRERMNRSGWDRTG